MKRTHDEPSTGRKRAAALVPLLVIAGLALAGCKQKNDYVAPPPPKVSVATPTVLPVTLYEEFTGNTAASAEVDLVARVSGVLQSIGYRDGEAVESGRVLFQIETDQYQAQVDLKQAELASAKLKQANAEREYNRQATLGQQQASSQRSVDETKTNFGMASATVAADTASLRIAQTSLDFTTVRAPFAGVVTRHLADVGALVGASGPTTLATILRVEPLDVYFNISEQQQIDMRDALGREGKTLRQMREGARTLPIEVALNQDSAFLYRGTVDYIAPQVNAATGTVQLRGVLENKDIALVPGQFVRVRIPVGRLDKALLVNDTAIQSNQTGSYVLVVGQDNTVEQRAVQTGPVEGPLRVITSGLAAGERVVIGAIQRAVPGSKVEPVAGHMEAAPEGETPAPAALKGDGSARN